MTTVTSAVLSHPGLRREANEDTVCARPDLGLFLVADGMGGHAAGEVASRVAAQAIETFINDTRDADVNTTWPFPYDTTLSLDGNRLTAAFRLANRRLTLAMQEDESLRTMATTAAALLINKGTPVVAHVGDSRLYRWRSGTLVQITQDHSWVTEQVRAGVLTETDAKSHPWRHVVTRALSGGEDPISKSPTWRSSLAIGCSFAPMVFRVWCRSIGFQKFSAGWIRLSKPVARS
jgi:protein phosphatase